MEQNSSVALESKISMVYNRFGSKSGQILKDINMIGGVPIFQAEKASKIVEQISGMEFLKHLM